MDATDAVITGTTLLLIVPLLFVEMPANLRGGYNSQFWRKSLDDKLDHIAAQPGHWTRMGVVWLPILVLAVAGTTAFSFQLAAFGAATWAHLGLGCYLMGAIAWLIGALIQTAIVRNAAVTRARTGSTPDWLDGPWNAAWWSELTFVVASSAAAILWGAGILDTGYPADWMGWTAVVLGILPILMVVFAREAFPHLGVLVPVVLGVALVLY